jgi:hypothetical protein
VKVSLAEYFSLPDNALKVGDTLEVALVLSGTRAENVYAAAEGMGEGFSFALGIRETGCGAMVCLSVVSVGDETPPRGVINLFFR